MLNPVLPPPRTRRIQTARNAVDVILNARSAEDLRLYEWEDRGKTPAGKTKWYDTDTKKTRYQISKPGTGRGGKKKEGEGAGKPQGEAEAGAGGKQKKTPTPRKPKVDHNEVGDRIEKMLGTDFADADVGALREELLSLTGAQLDELKKRFTVKGGKSKADVAGRIAGHVGGSRKPARELTASGPIDTFRQFETPMIQPGTEKAIRHDLESEEYSAGVHRRRLESIDATSRFGTPSLAMQNQRKEVAKKLAKSEANIAKLKKQLEQKQQERKPAEQPAPEAAPAPKKPRTSSVLPPGKPATKKDDASNDPRGQRGREGLGRASIGTTSRLHASMHAAGIRSSAVKRQAIADLESLASGAMTQKQFEVERSRMKTLARTAPTPEDRESAKEHLFAMDWVEFEALPPKGKSKQNDAARQEIVNEIKEMREANSANARKRLGGEQAGLFDSPPATQSPTVQPPVTQPATSHAPVPADVRSAAERKRAARESHARRLRSQGVGVPAK